MVSKKLPPVHPGEILMEEFLKPMGMSQYRLAKGISVSGRVPRSGVSEVAAASRRIL